MVEVWKTVPEDARYEVSSLGRLRFNGRDAPTYIANTGYRSTYLRKPTRKKVSLHRIVCEAFHGPSELPTVNHKDGDKLNNRADNLEWASYSDNQKHAIATGLNPGLELRIGEDVNTSKLTKADVLAIRENRNRLTGRAMASMYNVAESAISAIRLGKVWDRPDCYPAKEFPRPRPDRRKLMKPVVRGDGTEFSSITDAAKDSGVSPAGISNCLAGRQARAGGYCWKWKVSPRQLYQTGD